MSQSIKQAAVGELLRAAVDIADATTDLAERRSALIRSIAEITDSDSGHWAWGRGRPESEKIIMVGLIHFGYAEDQLAAFQQAVLDPEFAAETTHRLQEVMRVHKRPDGVWSVLTRDVLPEVNTDANNIIVQLMHRLNVAHWMQAGRYVPGDAFSSMTIGRRPGKPDYGDFERDLMDLVFTNIPWLWPSPDERVPQQKIETLSPRRRAVASLLLDGLSRKKIASRLGIGEETVNHHMKAVFQHFGVQSSAELAALFLRSQ